MKSLTGQGNILKNYHRLCAALTISAWFLCMASAPAAPRPPLPPIPEFASLLYHESFDAPFSSGITNAQVITDQFTYAESWSGYSLQRVGDIAAPFVVPALDFKGRTNVSCSQGTIRFWFKPAWSSVSSDKGAEPGTVAMLLELDAVGKGESAMSGRCKSARTETPFRSWRRVTVIRCCCWKLESVGRPTNRIWSG